MASQRPTPRRVRPMSRRGRSTPLALVLGAALLGLCGTAPAGDAPSVDVEVIADGLAWPWSLAFLPGGDFLVTERGGRLLRIDEASGEARPVTGGPAPLVAGQGGYQDVVLDPDFDRNGWLFLSYARGTPGANATTIHRARLDGDQLVDGRDVFAVTPQKTTAQHYGARMAFLPDGTLLMTTGDGWDHREEAQDRSGLLGKIVRLDRDGAPVPDNPFADDETAAPELYSYGHRNPQGLAVASDGTIWQHEHGPRGGDEINRIEAGENYGWPVATHGLDYIGARISPFTDYEGMRAPLHQWTPSIGPSGLAVYEGEVFDAWRGDLLVGGLAIPGLYRAAVVDGTVGVVERVVPAIDERVRDVRAGPDGYVYLLIDADPGRLLRLRPAPAP